MIHNIVNILVYVYITELEFYLSNSLSFASVQAVRALQEEMMLALASVVFERLQAVHGSRC